MLFAIGDIHGHFGKLVQLMHHCRSFAESRAAKPRFILLGDYVDRGPLSDAVVAFLANVPDDLIALRGNHEDMLLKALDDPEMMLNWIANGGRATLDSYGINHPRAMPSDHIEALNRLPLFHDDGRRLFVHAGIDAEDLDAREPSVLMWTRKHPPDDMALPRFLVHGHTPTRDRLPDLRPNRLNLDTGAGWGEALTAAAFDEHETLPLSFIRHDGQSWPAAVKR